MTLIPFFCQIVYSFSASGSREVSGIGKTMECNIGKRPLFHLSTYTESEVGSLDH